jgi:hypothetical protein
MVEGRWSRGIGGGVRTVRGGDVSAAATYGIPPLRDWHTAEDLAQTALAKVFVSWRKIRRQDAVHAYATRTLVNTYLAHRRLKRNGEVLRSWLPEPLAEAPAPETRMVLLDALATAEIFIRLLSTLNENGVRSLATARTFHLLEEPSAPEPLIPGFEGFDRFQSSFQKSSTHNERNNQKR